MNEPRHAPSRDVGSSVEAVTVFYDGSCPLCRVEIAYFKKRDLEDRLNTVDVSQPTPELPAGLDRSASMARFHVMSRDGSLLSGAAAFAEVWDETPGWRRGARIVKSKHVLPAAELAYGCFLALRPAVVRCFRALQRLSGGARRHGRHARQ